jgi:hypothetical protein
MMSVPIEAIVAIGIGAIGLMFSVKAFRTGHNALTKIGTIRETSPMAFTLETALFTVLSGGLIFLGLQIAKWN